MLRRTAFRVPELSLLPEFPDEFFPDDSDDEDFLDAPGFEGEEELVLSPEMREDSGCQVVLFERIFSLESDLEFFGGGLERSPGDVERALFPIFPGCPVLLPLFIPVEFRGAADRAVPERSVLGRDIIL